MGQPCRPQGPAAGVTISTPYAAKTFLPQYLSHSKSRKPAVRHEAVVPVVPFLHTCAEHQRSPDCPLGGTVSQQVC